MKTSTIVAILTVLIAIVAGWYWLGLPPLQGTRPSPAGAACTAEAMQCPDGSWVGRSGPNCEFVCPTATTSPSTTPSTGGTGAGSQGILPYHSGIRGTVLAGPTCPVERIPQDPACADRPLNISIAVYRTGGTQPFATTMSNAQGTFELSLPPGSYTVKAGGQATPPTCRPIEASVRPDAYTSVSVSCDTGIR